MPTPERTTLDEIVRAGRELVEAGGADALTMQAIAGRVGVRAPSLYKRVRNRDHLVGLVVDATADELRRTLDEALAGPSAAATAPDTEDRADRLRVLARAARAWAHAHPAAYGLLFSPSGRDVASEQALRSASETLVAVAETMVGPSDALAFARTITAWVTGFLAMELSGGFRLGSSVDDAFEYGIEVLAGAARG